MLFQPPLPDEYAQLSQPEILARIAQRKKELGDRMVILGHHYQQDDVIAFADFVGDSLKLSQLAAQQKQAEFVVFCGVHFMAESADILTEDHVKVILPDLSAGCSMADMAHIQQLEEAWAYFSDAGCDGIIPITYVNSSAAVKAFCGAHGGACCTSSNAKLVLEWALGEGERVLFLPDQHLGRNTAYALGFPLDSMVVYDPREPEGGLSADDLPASKFILWKGHCSVHALFTPQQCDQARKLDPDVTVLVHPECAWEVVQKADLSGSTEYIIKTVESAPAGTSWAIGTEIHLIQRLADRFAGSKKVRSLAGIQCLCTTMYRIDVKHLLWTLDHLAEGRVVNRIHVDPQTRFDAQQALDRMLANVSREPIAAK